MTTTIAQEAPSVSFEKEQWEGHLGTIYSPSASKTIGSGFVFGSHKDVITCAHVVAGGYFLCKDTNLVFFSQQPLGRSLKLKYILPRYDLAVLSPTPEIGGKPLKAGDFKKMRPGDQIIYIGYDQRRSSSTNVTSIASRAVVAATGSALNEGTTIDFLEFEGVGIPGYSGGPVFNAKGELVAIMREAWTKKGVKGGQEVLINRAFSVEVLSILENQVFSGTSPEQLAVATNKPSITLWDVLDAPKR